MERPDPDSPISVRSRLSAARTMPKAMPAPRQSRRQRRCCPRNCFSSLPGRRNRALARCQPCAEANRLSPSAPAMASVSQASCAGIERHQKATSINGRAEPDQHQRHRVGEPVHRPRLQRPVGPAPERPVIDQPGKHPLAEPEPVQIGRRLGQRVPQAQQEEMEIGVQDRPEPGGGPEEGRGRDGDVDDRQVGGRRHREEIDVARAHQGERDEGEKADLPEPDRARIGDDRLDPRQSHVRRQELGRRRGRRRVGFSAIALAISAG